jgi:G3E family GTPase
MSTPNIPVHLVTGATGAGKTSAIRRLLTKRPHAEAWIVIVNDFGEDTFASELDNRVTVREVAGCVCCSGQIALRITLVKLIRENRPQRVLIEASSAAEPATLSAMIQEADLSRAVELASNICVVNAEQIIDARYREHELYRRQIAAADAIYAPGLNGSASGARALQELQSLARPGTAVFTQGDSLDVHELKAVHKARSAAR